jgi:hypothetical protein
MFQVGDKVRVGDLWESRHYDRLYRGSDIPNIKGRIVEIVAKVDPEGDYRILFENDYWYVHSDDLSAEMEELTLQQLKDLRDFHLKEVERLTEVIESYEA